VALCALQARVLCQRRAIHLSDVGDCQALLKGDQLDLPDTGAVAAMAVVGALAGIG
jgi:hypothetical protein